jgi:hypothetical protein
MTETASWFNLLVIPASCSDESDHGGYQFKGDNDIF